MFTEKFVFYADEIQPDPSGCRKYYLQHDPDQLSRGAQEQLYLAMRLAHIRMHSGNSTTLPVIMDDIMVNFDSGRMERTIRAMSDLSKPADNHSAYQVFYFTCHTFVADKLQELIPGSSLFHVEAGRIYAANQ